VSLDPVPAATPAVVAGRPAPAVSKLLVPLAIGAAVSLALGTCGRVHSPTGVGVLIAGFSGAQAAKAWMASGVALLALVQLGSALVMYGKVPGISAPSWIGQLHRWSGRGAFLLAVPIALHCLYALGLSAYDTRVLVHSLLGCFFFGVFTAKMLLLPQRGLPGWALPLAGGLAFSAIVGLWLTSSLWFFTTVGLKF
jgi:Family of unknown function (DUF6529)